MDNDSYEQVYVPENLFGNSVGILKEGMEVKVAFESDQPILAEPPTFVELEITYCEPGVERRHSKQRVENQQRWKLVLLSPVPLFVNSGEKIKVDTRTMTYVERVK
jgi:elongation factor P